MSDTNFQVVAAVMNKKNIAVVDDDWIGDSLSDDGDFSSYFFLYCIIHY